MSSYAHLLSLMYFSIYVYIISFILVIVLSYFSKPRKIHNVFLYILSILILAVVPIINTITAIVIGYRELSDSYRDIKDNKELDEINKKYCR